MLLLQPPWYRAFLHLEEHVAALFHSFTVQLRHLAYYHSLHPAARPILCPHNHSLYGHTAQPYQLQTNVQHENKKTSPSRPDHDSSRKAESNHTSTKRTANMKTSSSKSAKSIASPIKQTSSVQAPPAQKNTLKPQKHTTPLTHTTRTPSTNDMKKTPSEKKQHHARTASTHSTGNDTKKVTGQSRTQHTQAITTNNTDKVTKATDKDKKQTHTQDTTRSINTRDTTINKTTNKATSQTRTQRTQTTTDSTDKDTKATDKDKKKQTHTQATTRKNARHTSVSNKTIPRKIPRKQTTITPHTTVTGGRSKLLTTQKGADDASNSTALFVHANRFQALSQEDEPAWSTK